MENLLRCYGLNLVLVMITGAVFFACNQSVELKGTEPQDITDVTLGATLSVNHENPGGPTANEGSNKLIDGDKYTKFLIFDYSPDYMAEQSFDSTVTVNAYTVTAANDAPERDPKDWTLEGSNDDNSWNTLDTQSDVNFDLRNKTNIYHLDSAVSYKYYRFDVTKDGGSNLMQLSEWRLLLYGGVSESSN